MDNNGETIYKTPMFLYFNIKMHLYLCLLVNETKNPQHLDCGRSIPGTHGDKTIPDSAEPRLESFYPPFVAGIDLSHQGLVDSYNLGLPRSIQWLLMSWLLASPGHQQPWYWLYRIGRPLSYLRKDFNYLGHISVKEWQNVNTCFCSLWEVNYVTGLIEKRWSEQCAFHDCDICLCDANDLVVIWSQSSTFVAISVWWQLNILTLST